MWCMTFEWQNITGYFSSTNIILQGGNITHRHNVITCIYKEHFEVAIGSFCELNWGSEYYTATITCAIMTIINFWCKIV